MEKKPPVEPIEDKAPEERFTGTDTPTPKEFTGFRHKEAFCIMEYNCNKCHHSEKVWNSRDGVTPFILSCEKCEGGEMRHINWHGDVTKPWHVPKKGERIFITMPKEVHAIYIRRRIDMQWENEQYPMREHFATKEEAFASLSDSYTEGEPWVITWEG